MYLRPGRGPAIANVNMSQSNDTRGLLSLFQVPNVLKTILGKFQPAAPPLPAPIRTLFAVNRKFTALQVRPATLVRSLSHCDPQKMAASKEDFGFVATFHAPHAVHTTGGLRMDIEDKCPMALAFSGDGKVVAVAGENTLYVYAEGRLICKTYVTGITKMKFMQLTDQDSLKTLLVVLTPYGIRVFEVSSEVRPLKSLLHGHALDVLPLNPFLVVVKNSATNVTSFVDEDPFAEGAHGASDKLEMRVIQIYPLHNNVIMMRTSDGLLYTMDLDHRDTRETVTIPGFTAGTKLFVQTHLGFEVIQVAGKDVHIAIQSGLFLLPLRKVMGFLGNEYLPENLIRLDKTVKDGETTFYLVFEMPDKKALVFKYVC